MSLGFSFLRGGLLIFMFGPKAYITDFQFYQNTVQEQFFQVSLLVLSKRTNFFWVMTRRMTHYKIQIGRFGFNQASSKNLIRFYKFW